MNTETNPEPSASNPIFDPFPTPQLFPVNWDLSEMVNPSSTQQFSVDLSQDKIVFGLNEFFQGY